MENSTFGRLLGALGLLLAGSYLLSQGLSNLILLPLAFAFAGLSGTQAQSQLQILQNEFVTQFMFGIVCLACSIFVAFFKLDTVGSRISPISRTAIPQLAQPTELSTEDLISELKSRMPRT